MTTRACLMALVFGLLASAMIEADEGLKKKPTKEELEKAHKAIVAKFPVLGREGAPPMNFIDSAVLERAFPGWRFFSVIYRMHPVAVLAPEPLKSQNVFLVGKDGDVEHLTNSKGLEKFFRAHLGE